MTIPDLRANCAPFEAKKVTWQRAQMEAIEPRKKEIILRNIFLQQKLFLLSRNFVTPSTHAKKIRLLQTNQLALSPSMCSIAETIDGSEPVFFRASGKVILK